jgi:hypothetical protein
MVLPALLSLVVLPPWHDWQLLFHAVFPNEPAEGIGVGVGLGFGVGFGVGIDVDEPCEVVVAVFVVVFEVVVEEGVEVVVVELFNATPSSSSSPLHAVNAIEVDNAMNRVANLKVDFLILFFISFPLEIVDFHKLPKDDLIV